MGEGEITGKMEIGAIVGKHPETAPVFLEFGLHCIGCRMAQSESLEDGARAHGITGARFAVMLAALNKAAAGKR